MVIEIIDDRHEGIRSKNFETKVLERPPEIPGFILGNFSIWDDDIAKKEKVMVNFPRYFYKSFEIKGNKLIHTVTLSDYKTFYVANKIYQENLRKADMNSKKQNRKILDSVTIEGLVLIIETSDNKIIVGKKGSRVAYGGGLLHVLPTGGFMPKHFEDVIHPNPFISAVIQAKDELNIKLKEEEILYLGTLRDLISSWNPTMVFYTKLDKTFEKLVKSVDKAADRWETGEILHISSKSDDLMKIISDKKYGEFEWIPISLGTLLIFGLHRYGENWHKEAQKLLKNAP
jgi:hypothetical protein